MLHLLLIRLVIQGVAALAGIAVVAAVYAGIVGTGDALGDMAAIIRWSTSIAAATIVLLFASWRWVPPLQLLIFPYLGGTGQEFSISHIGASRVSATFTWKLNIPYLGSGF